MPELEEPTPFRTGMRGPGRPLPRELRARAERFFRAELSAVRLHALASALDPLALAYTWGDEIYLSPAALGLPSPALLELLGHELAHVVQQRQDRVRVCGGIAARSPDDDRALEAEAVDAGRRFAAGEALSGFAGTFRLRVQQRPAVQRAVTIGGQTVASADALSEKSRKVLALVPSGLRWLAWAIGNQADVYGFADEESLVEAIHIGIHGDGLMLLKTASLQVHVRRLLELSVEDLSRLEAIERRGGDNKGVDVKTKRMLAANRLWTQTHLAVGRESVGDDIEPVFQSLSLAGQVWLFDLVEGAASDVGLDPDVQKEATAFAQERGVAPAEFADFYQLYMVVADAIRGKGAAAKRAALAGKLISALEPNIFGLLKCPFVPHDLAPEEMMQRVREWLESGSSLGFSRLSHGLCEVVQEGGPDTLDPDAAAETVARYTDGLRQLLQVGEPTATELSQDGSTRTFRVESESAVGELAHVRHLATLTTESFRKTGR